MGVISRKAIIFFIIAVITAVLLSLGVWIINTANLLEKNNDNPTTQVPIMNPISSEASDGYYMITDSGHEGILFSNQVDGYSVLLPDTMKVTETKLADYRMVLEDELRRIEIYKQPISEKSFSADTYISYSNGFLRNTADHKLEFQESVEVNGYKVIITQWSREKVLNIENDKNHYACIDIISKDDVYTFLIKSQMKLEDPSNFMKLIESFYTFSPSVTPASIKFFQTETKAWNAETTAFYDKYYKERKKGPLIWGIFNNSAPKEMNELKEIEAAIDYKFKFLLIYKHIQEIFPVGYVRNDLERAYRDGRVVELTLQTPTRNGGEANMVYDILDGKYDHFLYSFAEETAKFGHPVLFRFCNEMNGDWCSYSGYHTSRDPEIFKELYRYVYKVFDDVNANNVIWIWNPNELSYPDFKWNNELLYYPGDDYVDVVGLTGYNTGTYYEGEKWRTFSEIYDSLYEKFDRISGKPLMITEFASSSVGGNKKEWVNDMFLNIYKYPRIKVAIWWHGCDLDAEGNIARPYFINEPPDLLDAFKIHLNHLSSLAL